MGSLNVLSLATIFAIVFKCIRCIENATEMPNANETFKMEGKIVGGSVAKIENFPHAVFLFADCAKHFWTCGSSVLNQQILLTAGHCVYGCRGDFKIQASAGSANYVKAETVRQVARYVLHRDYNDDSVACDIAVLLLDKKLIYSNVIKRIIIRPNMPGTTPKGFVAGWGSINEHHDVTTTLKFVDQTVWPPHDCQKTLQMNKGTICASQGRGSYVFSGDSGSGLVTSDFQAIGLVSYRMGSIKKDLAVYTNVSLYYNWIREKVFTIWCHKSKKLN